MTTVVFAGSASTPNYFEEIFKLIYFDQDDFYLLTAGNHINVAITGTESGAGFALKMEQRDMRKRGGAFGVR